MTSQIQCTTLFIFCLNQVHSASSPFQEKSQRTHALHLFSFCDLFRVFQRKKKPLISLLERRQMLKKEERLSSQSRNLRYVALLWRHAVVDILSLVLSHWFVMCHLPQSLITCTLVNLIKLGKLLPGPLLLFNCFLACNISFLIFITGNYVTRNLV